MGICTLPIEIGKINKDSFLVSISEYKNSEIRIYDYLNYNILCQFRCYNMNE